MASVLSPSVNPREPAGGGLVLPLPAGFARSPAVLAMGIDPKAAFCLVKDGTALLSEPLGDLSAPAAWEAYRRSLAAYRDQHAHRAQLVAVDLDPQHQTTRLGGDQGLPVAAVQHHHAHVAACLAEHGAALDSSPVLGIVMDGVGFGEDGSLWGGEFLLADYRGARRLASLPAVPMPGGKRAVRQPWRNTYAHIRAGYGWKRFEQEHYRLELARFLRAKPLALLDCGINNPPSSSCERLLDAVAAALGLCRESTSYEGEAADRLEALVDRGALGEAGYAFGISLEGLWSALLEDIAADAPPATIAARFHSGLARAIAEAAIGLRESARFDRVALTGSVFRNSILRERVERRLLAAGLEVLAHRRAPADDGGLALGQAAVAAARGL